MTGKRDDGYHELFTIYHSISLFDKIHINEGALSVDTNIGIPQEENFVYKALKIMERKVGRLDYSIFIEKNIPHGAGLGGGSSNVAVTLNAVNRLSENPLGYEELKSICAEVSSDAAFFLHCGTAVGTGRGEMITPVRHHEYGFTLVYPNIKVSTPKVYSMVKGSDIIEPDRKRVLAAIERGNAEDVVENRLGEICAESFVEVANVMAFLKNKGRKPFVSGSGSSVFCFGEPDEEMLRQAGERGWKAYSVRSFSK